MEEKDLAPWEVPPDESYWQALLQEEPDAENGAFIPILPPLVPSPSQDTPSAHPVGDDPQGPGVSPSSQDRARLRPTTHDAPSDLGAPPERTESQPTAEPLPAQPELSESWHLFCQHRDEDKTVDLTVESYNRGGLLVRWEEVVGFVPASQLCDGLRYGDEQARLKDLATRVGSSLTLKVIEVDPAKNRLILSERAARHVDDPDLDVLDELSPGDVCPGEVTNLCTFGAFIDLGGVEGLIHISELSWGRVSHPADILSSGEQVEVYVLNVDRDQGRVGLSLKRLQPDPWNTVDERYHVGQVIEGLITNIVNFGAFVRLEEGLEGLIHTSELHGGSTSHAHPLREGAQIMVRIQSIEADRHRIGLTPE